MIKIYEVIRDSHGTVRAVNRLPDHFYWSHPCKPVNPTDLHKAQTISNDPTGIYIERIS